MPGFRVDGMDVFAVYDAAAQAVARARAGEGPTLLECKTYRFHGHNMGDPQQYRTRDEIAEWSESRDPIASFENYLTKQEILTAHESEAIQKQAAEEIQEAVTFADESPYPGPEELYRDVYSYEIT
jgi:pyruvate dehydrogenase E1 component alpha subunit